MELATKQDERIIKVIEYGKGREIKATYIHRYSHNEVIEILGDNNVALEMLNMGRIGRHKGMEYIDLDLWFARTAA